MRQISIPRRAPAPAPPRHPARRAHPRRSDEQDDDALLARLPTDREIAEMIRGRPIGAVLVDICADLGIGINHPLWHELRSFIIDHNSTPEPMMLRTFQRTFAARRAK